jgi:hypothetical protein
MLCHACQRTDDESDLEEKAEALAMSHDTFGHNTRNQLRQVFDALRELGLPRYRLRFIVPAAL